jgi:hypothetical protein
MNQIVPLNRFYEHVHSVLSIYRESFQKLADPNSRISTRPPKHLDSALDAAMDELLSFQRVLGMDADSPAQEKVHVQVDDMAGTAADLYIGLEDIRDEVIGFLGRLHNDPGSRNRLLAPAAQNASVSSFASLFSYYRKAPYDTNAP